MSRAMEAQTASVYSTESVPRLRVTRHTTSPPTVGSDAGQGPLVSRPMELKRSLSYPDSQTTSDDDSGTLSNVGTTSRLLSASLPPQDSTHELGDPTHRLRAILSRFDTHSRTPASASRTVMPPSPSEVESDFDIPSAQAARASIKDLFKNALREPSDTPQKPRPTRRASFNAVGSPKVNKSRRKSTSDEEKELLAKRQDERPSDLSTAASLDRLRLQLTESMPSIQSHASSSSTSRPPSETSVFTRERATPSHHRASNIPVAHSPVKNAKSHQDLEPFTAVNESDHDDLYSPQRQFIYSGHKPRVQTPQSLPPHTNGKPSVARLHSHNSAHHEFSHMNSSQSGADHRENERSIERERDPHRQHHPPPTTRIRTTSAGHLHSSTEKKTGRVSPGAWPTPPPPGSSPSGTRSRHRGGSADGHSEDDRSSRGTSASSNAEYRDRLKETEQERQRELERSWNRPRSVHSQSVTHSHTQDPDLHGHTSRHVSALDESHSRPHSRFGYEQGRASPSSSTSSRSHHEEELEEELEEEHERERNWNAPHPKWSQHPHHGPKTDHHKFPASFSPTPPHVSGPEQGNGTSHSLYRTSSSTSLGLAPDHLPESQLQDGHLRPHSRLGNVHDHSRSGSPSSSTSSRSHRDAEEPEELHERERNWNAPRPKWEPHPHHQHHSHEADHHTHSPLPAHDSSIDKERERSWNRHRLTPSLGVPTNGHRPRSVSPAPLSHLHSSNSNKRQTDRSKSPLPRPHSPTNEKVKGRGKDLNLDREKGRNSPKLSPSHRHERTPSSPSPAPSQNGSRSGRTPSRSVVRPRRTSSPTPPSHPGTDSKKGHRRTTTELSESMGPFPRQITLPPSLAVPDESNFSLFADESVPPPQMSTPTFKATHLSDLSELSDASDIPLPPSPPSSRIATREPAARADADLARLQRAVAPDFTFPARQSSPPAPPTASPLSTPPRRSSSNAQKLEFKTPSPPVGLPELPGPPSSDEEEMKTPVRANGEAKAFAMTVKTPRFPGAFGTPAPPVRDPVTSPTPEDESATSEEIEATPKLGPIDVVPFARTQSNGEANDTSGPTSVPLTPAPPGAYRATPTPAKRKGILKVRFDGDVQAPGKPVNGFVGAATGDAVKQDPPPPSPSSDDIPPLNLSPSRRKGLRLVDEYGRERRFTEDGEEIVLDSRRKLAGVADSPKVPSSVDDTTMTPRRRAKMRQLDPLGKEVVVEPEATEKQDEVIPEVKGGKRAVFSRLTRSLIEINHDLAQEEDALAASVPQSGQREDERLMELATASKAARVERNKLARKLQLERHAEGGIPDKIFITRHPARDLSSETSDRGSWWTRKWRLVLIISILEMMLLYMGYRLAMIHAKQSWLTTYFDPFFPALYLHQSKPSFLSRFGTLPVDWSAFAISGAVKRVGVRGFVVGVSQRLWEEIWSWRVEPWEAWGSPAAGSPVPRAWPS